MLRTFDENLVITAVQQLTTDLDSLSGRIKKLEEGGGGGALVFEKTYTDVNITNTTEATFDTVSLGDDFTVAQDEYLLMFVNFDNEESHPKMLKNVEFFDNIGNGPTYAFRDALLFLYMNSSGTPTRTTTISGIYSDLNININTKTLTLKSKYNASYGYCGGTVTVKIYKMKYPE